MSQRGVEGTVLGTVFMPLFSGLGNLMLVFVVLRRFGPAEEVAVNCVVNNLTNLTLLIALPALIWGLDMRFFMHNHNSLEESMEVSSLRRLSLKLTTLAMIFFTGAVYTLGRDGVLDQNDGIVLVGLFFFWQAFHVYEVKKEAVRGAQPWGPGIILDLILIAIGSLATLVSVDGIVASIMTAEIPMVGGETLGLLTGWLMVLPNAILAFYYAKRRKPEVVYSSQIGDGHICIPLCLGLFALNRDLPITGEVSEGLILILAGAAVHLYCLLVHHRLPAIVATALLAGYGYFVYTAI
jgi:cation:H+ antiporter